MATTDNANVTSNPVTATDYTETSTVKTTEHVQGNKVTFTSDIDTDASGQFDKRVEDLVNGKVNALMAEREQRENIRANHRNLNRMLTLFGALVIGLVVTFVLQHRGIPGLVTLPAWSLILAPYTFVITIALDSGLALYGYIRHY
jgi:hypothetical protein